MVLVKGLGLIALQETSFENKLPFLLFFWGGGDVRDLLVLHLWAVTKPHSLLALKRQRNKHENTQQSVDGRRDATLTVFLVFCTRKSHVLICTGRK